MPVEALPALLIIFRPLDVLGDQADPGAWNGSQTSLWEAHQSGARPNFCSSFRMLCSYLQRQKSNIVIRSSPAPEQARQCRRCRPMPTASQKKLITDNIRGVPDFPKKGILFWDITTLCLNPTAFQQCIDLFVERYKGKQIDVVAGEPCRIDVSHLRPARCTCPACASTIPRSS